MDCLVLMLDWWQLRLPDFPRLASCQPGERNEKDRFLVTRMCSHSRDVNPYLGFGQCL